MHPSDNATDDLPGVTRRPSPVWTVAVNSAVTRTDAAKPQVRRELLGEQQVLRKLRPTACRAGHAVAGPDLRNNDGAGGGRRDDGVRQQSRRRPAKCLPVTIVARWP